MCINTMTNDGGLRSVLQTSELVSNGLSSLCNQSSSGIAPRPAEGGVKRKPSRSLSEISGNTDKSNIRMDLSRHTSSELKKVVTPLVKELEQLDAAALLSLNPSKNNNSKGAILRKGLTVPPIHDRVSPQYGRDEGNIVRYLHVKEVPNKFSVGIFVFPPNAEIPLHDHPDMVVLSRVLYGELKVQSFDVLPDGNNENGDSNVDNNNNTGTGSSSHKRSCNDETMATSPTRPPLTLRASFNKIKDFVARALSIQDDDNDDEDMQQADSVLHVKPNLNPMGVQSQPQGGPSIISAPNVTCLFPHEGNCHAFVAGPKGAAVLDVLLPPYGTDDDRDCTFYVKADDEDRGNGNGVDDSLTLAPINQPEDFHCLSGAYGRFGACNNYCDNDVLEDDTKGVSCNII